MTNTNGGFLRGCVVSCLLILCLCCCCFMCIGGVFLTTSSAAIGSLSEASRVFNKVCNISNTELRTVYEETFTRAFKNETSFSEFQEFYDNNTHVPLT